MRKEEPQGLPFESHVKMQANRTVFELSQFKRNLINNNGHRATERQNENPLEGARDNLRFTTEQVLPICRDFFKLAGRGFDLGHPSISFAGGTAISYDPDLDSLTYAFAPGRKPAILSDDILKRLYNASINPEAVETFGRLSKAQIINEVIFAIKHPRLKIVKDAVLRVTGVV